LNLQVYNEGNIKKKDRVVKEKIKFLCIGFMNTLFGFSIGVLLLTLLKENIGIFSISILSSTLSIIFSFATYRIFHFKSKAKKIPQFIRGILVYLVLFTINGFMLSICIEKLNGNAFLSQMIIMLFSVFYLYICHTYFTFKVTKS
jgi:putative flippase GtrA